MWGLSQPEPRDSGRIASPTGTGEPGPGGRPSWGRRTPLRHRTPPWTLRGDSGGRGPTRTRWLSPSSPARVPHGRQAQGCPFSSPVPGSSSGGGRSQVKTTLAEDPHFGQQGSAPGSTESGIRKRGPP